MIRHPALIRLSREHNSGLLLAQQMKTGAAPYRGYPTDIEGKIQFLIAEYEIKLKPHFAQEEEILFPKAGNVSAEMATLVEELVSEHRQLHLLIASVSSSPNKNELLNEIGVLLEKHIRKEERKLFEGIQQAFNEAELLALDKALNS